MSQITSLRAAYAARIWCPPTKAGADVPQPYLGQYPIRTHRTLAEVWNGK